MAVIIAGATNWSQSPTGIVWLYGANTDQVLSTKGTTNGHATIRIDYSNIDGDGHQLPVVILSPITPEDKPFIEDIGVGWCLVGGVENFHFILVIG